MRYLFVFLLVGLISCGDDESSKNDSSKVDSKNNISEIELGCDCILNLEKLVLAQKETMKLKRQLDNGDNNSSAFNGKQQEIEFQNVLNKQMEFRLNVERFCDKNLLKKISKPLSQADFETLKEKCDESSTSLQSNDLMVQNNLFQIQAIEKIPDWAYEQDCFNCIITPCGEFELMEKECKPILIFNQQNQSNEYLYLQGNDEIYELPLISREIDGGNAFLTFSDNVLKVSLKMYECSFRDSDKCGEVVITSNGEIVFSDNEITGTY